MLKLNDSYFQQCFLGGITRAKKDVFITANTGINENEFNNQTSCLLNLLGLTCEDYS